jgi:hypothetical protein
MSSTEPQTTGYAVTLTVVVPAGVAERKVDELDRQWQVESWTPQAAAFVAARDALSAAGLIDATVVSTAEVRS